MHIQIKLSIYIKKVPYGWGDEDMESFNTSSKSLD